MKLIIQIPCYNEEQTLPLTLADLPRSAPGVDRVEWLVIDDGSTDGTVRAARENGVDHVVSHKSNRGLAQAHLTGLQACLDLGADIIVNTDADNQYSAAGIPDLIRPILEGRAEIVIGARPIDQIEHFSWIKRWLQKVGSWTVRMASQTDIPDAPSGFRAISREAAKQINVFSSYTYTLEEIIQAGLKRIPITWVPVETNAYQRPSRLVKSITRYVARSVLIIVRIFIVYKPFAFFISVGAAVSGLGVLVGLRFLFFYFQGDGGGHIQSLILASILIGVGFQTIMTAFIADVASVNRRLLEDVQSRLRKKE